MGSNKITFDNRPDYKKFRIRWIDVEKELNTPGISNW